MEGWGKEGYRMTLHIDVAGSPKSASLKWAADALGGGSAQWHLFLGHWPIYLGVG